MTWIDRHADEVFLGAILITLAVIIGRGVGLCRPAFRMNLLCLAMWVAYNYLHNFGPWTTLATILVDVVLGLFAWAWYLREKADGQLRRPGAWVYQWTMFLLVLRILWHVAHSADPPGYSYALGNNLLFAAMIVAAFLSAIHPPGSLLQGFRKGGQ